MAPHDMAALAVRATLRKRYFEFPDSLPELTPVYERGLIPIAFFAMLSLLSVSALLIFITNRLISWRKHYKEYVGYNQYVILIYNLLLADLQQAIAFTMSFHWLRLDAILAPTAPCFIQGWFLNIGDVASGFFVLAIAIHTWLSVIKGYRLPYLWFVVSILFIWLLALLLTLVGPLMHRDKFFTRAGGWCWISTHFQSERLWLHYFWVFLVEFGTIAIYTYIFFHLRGRLRSIMNHDASKLSRATKFMIMYPAVYVLLTLPIAVGRMVAMTGTQMPDEFFCVAGALLTSCGWIDALLYTLTRRVFIANELGTHSRHAYSENITAATFDGTRPGDDFGLQSIKTKTDIGTARTVTIVGGKDRGIPRLTDRGRSHIREKHGHPDPLRENSPTGSQDSIIKPGTNTIGIVTETNIQIESRSADSEDSILPNRLESRNHSPSARNPHAL